MDDFFSISQLDCNNTGMVYKYKKEGNVYVHTMCEGEMLYKLGFSPEDIAGKTLHELYPKELADKKLEFYHKAWNGEFVQYELNVYGVCSVASLRPMFQGNKVVEVIGSCIDITEKKRLEEDSRQNDRLREAVFTTMSEGVFILDKSGKIITLNNNIQTKMGIDNALDLEFFQDHLLEEYGIEILNEVGEVIPYTESAGFITLREGISIHNAVYGIRQNGQLLMWISVNSKAFSVGAVGEQASLVSVRDITVQKEQSLKLAEAYAFQNTLINHLGSGIVAIDQNRCVKWMNTQFHEMFQLKDKIDFYIGKNSADFNRLFLQGQITKSVLKPEGCNRYSAEIELFDKIIKCTNVQLESQQEFLGEMWKFEDITERKAMETAILHAKEEAEKANNAKSDFLSKMSHELRTPLSGVLGFAQLLEIDPSLHAEQQDFVKEILDGGRHLLNLINEVLDLSRIESGNLKATIEEVDFHEILNHCLKMVQPLAIEKNILLKKASIPHKPIMVSADPIRLKQILINLLDNAIKFNKVNGEVHISIQIEKQKLKVHVKDTGEGFAKAESCKVFVPFYRIHGTKAEGTGIGLSLVKQLVELMGGKVGVNSQPQRGSDFWFTLPLSCQQLYSMTTRGSSIAEDTTNAYGKYNVLYIEDNEANVLLMEKLLGQWLGIHLISAADGCDGIRKAKEKDIDLILLDLDLPDLNGAQVFDILKENNATKDIPVVAVSANAMPKDIQMILSKGFTNYITKPLDIHNIVSVVKGLLCSGRK
ncbi:ATP-binding protein [Peribacillus sp. SCS-155]|uniref:ATP-binding protein n=1 Tax=Peribacillus sedimenti TaxID=3115297 RepID=UPI003905BD5B